jgi:CheY-like chemotaxis protein/HPt (histidine-containing phosphotransfer) domain-containing protein
MTELTLDTELNRQQREFLNIVAESGEVLLRLINDILDLSKIEAGKVILERTPFDLEELIGDTMKSMAIRAHSKDLELTYFIRPQVPNILEGDGDRLRQVVVNLISNAIKFTDSGEVSLDIHRDSVVDDKVFLHFTVSDTGIGIAPNKQTLIFEMFEQADSTITRRYGGTGLGLTISSHLVKLMGGKIWVQSELDKGSTFHFTVPFGIVSEVELPQRGVARMVSAPNNRVMVVDDNDTNRRILQELLLNWNFRPCAFANAQDALMALREAHRAGDPYSLVLSDVHMPNIDGFALAQQIIAEPELCDTLIMMLSSIDKPDEVARCEQLGISIYLVKPVKQSELYDAIMLAMGLALNEPVFTKLLPAQDAPISGPLNILLAEDSPVNQKLALALLGKWGHTVIVASDGYEALAMATSQSFDLVLMDVQMPQMDGIEATRAIRARERQKGGHLPIIAMTAHALKGDRERCLAAGMDAYIAKPIHSRELYEIIREICDRFLPPELNGDANNAPPKLDWTAALNATADDPQILLDFVKNVIEETPAMLAKVREAIAMSDSRALEISAHSLKSVVHHFGSIPAYTYAQKLEQLAHEGSFTNANQLLETLEKELSQLINYLQNHQNSNHHKA